MTATTQPGITPPTPGQHKEEPDFWNEEDIPSSEPGTESDPERRGSTHQSPPATPPQEQEHPKGR